VLLFNVFTEARPIINAKDAFDSSRNASDHATHGTPDSPAYWSSRATAGLGTLRSSASHTLGMSNRWQSEAASYDRSGNERRLQRHVFLRFERRTNG